MNSRRKHALGSKFEVQRSRFNVDHNPNHTPGTQPVASRREACYFRGQVKESFGILTIAILVSFLVASCTRTGSKPSASGTIDADEVHVASRYGGRVEKVLAQEGDTLKSGQPLVELDAAELKARRDQAAALLAELEAGPRKEEIEAAKHDWESLV